MILKRGQKQIKAEIFSIESFTKKKTKITLAKTMQEKITYQFQHSVKLVR